MIHVFNECQKNNNQENILNQDNVLCSLAINSEVLLKNSKKICSEYLNILEFSTKNYLIENSKLITSYEKVKNELDHEKKSKKIYEFEKNHEIELLKNELKKTYNNLREKSENLEEMTIKYENLQELTTGA